MKLLRLTAAAALLALAACSHSPTAAESPAMTGSSATAAFDNGTGFAGGGTRSEP